MDTHKILGSAGVDTTAFFNAVDKAVQEGYSAQLRKLAESERAGRTSRATFLTELASMSRDVMIALFNKVSEGEFGMVYRDAALARCRNKTPSQLTDEELRTWLEDIGEIVGESSQ